jgi:hypothetical protein
MAYHGGDRGGTELAYLAWWIGHWENRARGIAKERERNAAKGTVHRHFTTTYLGKFKKRGKLFEKHLSKETLIKSVKKRKHSVKPMFFGIF